MLPKNSLMSHVSKRTWHRPKRSPGHDSHGTDSDRAQALGDICILCCSGSGMWSVLSSRARIYLSLLHQGLRGLCTQTLRGMLCWYQMSSYSTFGPLYLFCSPKRASTCVKGFSSAETLLGVTGGDTWHSLEKVNQAPKQSWAETAISTPFVHPCIHLFLSSLVQLACNWAWSPERAAVTCRAHIMATSRKASVLLVSQMSLVNIKCLCSPRPRQLYKLM